MRTLDVCLAILEVTATGDTPLRQLTREVNRKLGTRYLETTISARRNDPLIKKLIETNRKQHRGKSVVFYISDRKHVTAFKKQYFKKSSFKKARAA